MCDLSSAINSLYLIILLEGKLELEVDVVVDPGHVVVFEAGGRYKVRA